MRKGKMCTKWTYTTLETPKNWKPWFCYTMKQWKKRQAGFAAQADAVQKAVLHEAHERRMKVAKSIAADKARTQAIRDKIRRKTLKRREKFLKLCKKFYDRDIKLGVKPKCVPEKLKRYFHLIDQRNKDNLRWGSYGGRKKRSATYLSKRPPVVILKPMPKRPIAILFPKHKSTTLVLNPGRKGATPKERRPMLLIQGSDRRQIRLHAPIASSLAVEKAKVKEMKKENKILKKQMKKETKIAKKRGLISNFAGNKMAKRDKKYLIPWLKKNSNRIKRKKKKLTKDEAALKKVNKKIKKLKHKLKKTSGKTKKTAPKKKGKKQFPMNKIKTKAPAKKKKKKNVVKSKTGPKKKDKKQFPMNKIKTKAPAKKKKKKNVVKAKTGPKKKDKKQFPMNKIKAKAPAKKKTKNVLKVKKQKVTKTTKKNPKVIKKKITVNKIKTKTAAKKEKGNVAKAKKGPKKKGKKLGMYFDENMNKKKLKKSLVSGHKAHIHPSAVLLIKGGDSKPGKGMHKIF